jgi:undecaprenyl-diphosphatase
MIDLLFTIDKTIFIICNRTIANPALDAAMPFLTDLNKNIFGLSFFALLWLWLVWKGGRRGRIIGALLVVLVAFSDQFSSTVIKNIVQRPRPCHNIDGRTIIENIRLLVPCGSGFSFPSSHAVNNFAVATLLSYYYRKWTWLFMTIAAVVAFSRIYVGVHFPSDVAGGALIGAICAWCINRLHQAVSSWFPSIRIASDHDGSITT